MARVIVCADCNKQISKERQGRCPHCGSIRHLNASELFACKSCDNLIPICEAITHSSSPTGINFYSGSTSSSVTGSLRYEAMDRPCPECRDPHPRRKLPFRTLAQICNVLIFFIVPAIVWIWIPESHIYNSAGQPVPQLWQFLLFVLGSPICVGLPIFGIYRLTCIARDAAERKNVERLLLH